MNKKRIWTNKYFRIEFYNLGLLSIQFTILVGLLAISLFATHVAIERFCVVMMVLDALCFLIVLIRSSEFTTEEESATPTKSDSVDVEIDHKSTKKQEKKPVKKSSDKDNVISNKVPVPVPTAVPEKSDTPETVSKPDVAKGTVPTKKFSEMSDEDWDNIWNM